MADIKHENRITRAVDRLLGDAMITQENGSTFCGICNRVVYGEDVVYDEDEKYHDVFCPVPLLERWIFGPND